MHEKSGGRHQTFTVESEDIVRARAVSYTHLDVYKRQIRDCAALSMPERMARTASISLMRRAIR